MKRKKIMILAGGFVLLTLLIGMKHDEPMYEKKKTFSTSSEILQELDGKPLVKEDYKGSDLFTDDTLECFSQRERLTDIDTNFSKLEIKEVVQLDSQVRDFVLDQYNKLRENFTKRKPVDRVEVVRIKALPYYHNFDDGKIVYEPYSNNQYMDIVLIDEGEGMVIDYIRTFDDQHAIEDEIND